MHMIKVNGGSFFMGDTFGGGCSDERPTHQVTLSPFWIGKYEVTQREWREVMGNNPSHFQGDDRPVEQVSWYDAIDYCNKRSIKEGLTPCYTRNGDTVTCNWQANGYRLPTEAEWEYAARGGSGTRDMKYSGSDSVDDVAWYDGNSGSTTHPVGRKRPNVLGLYDMSGNVWEWCWDCYGLYSSHAKTAPLGASSRSGRVYRGGGWNFSTAGARIAYRNFGSPGFCYNNIGFRVVRSSLC